ncbi:hypothetical protein IW16_18975 [Chryseobacterium vrystaatense]|uniref:Uncharacterized protein n=1 Tax=Chryseobacterium vrystaatense TaxID=307480 RepID=A0ABR4UIC2_9FLAO|nr:hypothetical protein IW16_18975 [Chryseobacterium vrystaatense]
MLQWSVQSVAALGLSEKHKFYHKFLFCLVGREVLPMLNFLPFYNQACLKHLMYNKNRRFNEVKRQKSFLNTLVILRFQLCEYQVHRSFMKIFDFLLKCPY